MEHTEPNQISIQIRINRHLSSAQECKLIGLLGQLRAIQGEEDAHVGIQGGPSRLIDIETLRRADVITGAAGAMLYSYVHGAGVDPRDLDLHRGTQAGSHVTTGSNDVQNVMGVTCPHGNTSERKDPANPPSREAVSLESLQAQLSELEGQIEGLPVLARTQVHRAGYNERNEALKALREIIKTACAVSAAKRKIAAPRNAYLEAETIEDQEIKEWTNIALRALSLMGRCSAQESQDELEMVEDIELEFGNRRERQQRRRRLRNNLARRGRHGRGNTR